MRVTPVFWCEPLTACGRRQTVSQVRAKEQPFLQTGESHGKLSIFQNSYACNALLTSNVMLVSTFEKSERVSYGKLQTLSMWIHTTYLEFSVCCCFARDRQQATESRPLTPHQFYPCAATYPPGVSAWWLRIEKTLDSWNCDVRESRWFGLDSCCKKITVQWPGLISH